MSAASPRTAIAFLAAGVVLGAIFWWREHSRVAPAPTAAPTATATTPLATAAPIDEPIAVPVSTSAEPAASAEPAQIPVVESTGPDPATLADITAAVRTAIKKEVRRCNPGRPITPAIASHRIVFYFTQQVVAGAVRLVDVVKIDSDLGDERLESCVLNRVADVRLSAPGAADNHSRLQETVDLANLAPSP